MIRTLRFPHCWVHIIERQSPLNCEAGILDLEAPSPVGYEVTIQVPEDYRPAKLSRCNLDAPCLPERLGGRAELSPSSQWDRHSGFLWLSAPVSLDLKAAFKMMMLELAIIGWWELVQEIYEQAMAQAGQRSDA